MVKPEKKEIMTREEIIEKGERRLQFTLDELEKGGIPTTHISDIAYKGLTELDMLFYILDEEYGNYDYWFNKFNTYI